MQYRRLGDAGIQLSEIGIGSWLTYSKYIANRLGCYRPQSNQPIYNLINRSLEIEATLSQLALAWTLRFHAVTSAIIGASKPEQVTENVKASDITLSQDILDKIDKIMGAAPVDQFTGQQIAPFGSGVSCLQCIHTDQKTTRNFQNIRVVF